MKNNIVVHCVGARGGSVSFKIPPSFRNDFTVVLYEPDKDAIERIEKYSTQHYGQHHILPYCLDNKISTAVLNINRDPNTSSLLKQNLHYREYYFFQDGNYHYDYVWGETSETIIEMEINTTTLDKVIETENIPSPDIFCLDTQGSEHCILEGSAKALTKTLAVISEVEFSPLYADQPLFGDVSHLLRNYGFEFVCFDTLTEMSPLPMSIASRGKGSHVSADAVFVKSLTQIKIDFPGQHERDNAILKLAFFLICRGHVELAIKLMEKTSAEFLENKLNLSSAKYVRFCREFYLAACSANTNPNRVPTFSETFNLDQSMERSRATTENFKIPARVNVYCYTKTLIKSTLKRITPLASIVHFVNNSRNHAKEWMFVFKNKKNSSIENLLFDYKFDEISALIKKNRLKCSLGLFRDENRRKYR
ncbi:MAG: hypothetical protein A3B71_05130 [Gammaproteobacteria bacterium RIFCSPHIGHO2_02_FULL_42_43]|nr:MAG: hypothetical protein A3B71_05130 [Gammaproteobacteria bacterium RIFCSPHIGHO2_02_FULL_42_43]